MRDGEKKTYSTSEHAEGSLVDIHDRVVFPFVTINLLKNISKYIDLSNTQKDS